MAHDVFLTYSTKDKPVAEAVCAGLERNGISVWMAPRDIVPGSDWPSSIIQGIDNARVVVLIFSKAANESRHIAREVEHAIDKGFKVIPFRIENIEPKEALEYFLGSSQWLDAYIPPLEQHFEKLADVVRKTFPPSPTPSPPPPPPTPSPTPPPPPSPPPRKRRGVIIGGLLLAALVVSTIFFAWPWLKPILQWDGKRTLNVEKPPTLNELPPPRPTHSWFVVVASTPIAGKNSKSDADAGLAKFKQRCGDYKSVASIVKSDDVEGFAKGYWTAVLGPYASEGEAQKVRDAVNKQCSPTAAYIKQGTLP